MDKLLLKTRHNEIILSGSQSLVKITGRYLGIYPISPKNILSLLMVGLKPVQIFQIEVADSE